LAERCERRAGWSRRRQRLWRVPIVAFHCGGCGADILDADLVDHVADIFAEHAADTWYERSASELLPGGFRCPECGGRLPLRTAADHA